MEVNVWPYSRLKTGHTLSEVIHFMIDIVIVSNSIFFKSVIAHRVMVIINPSMTFNVNSEKCTK